ncbi:PREDICTED: pinopsin-like [Branchiostoma belcheri]|uniref:Pinopsin-like n=1 Tax=Branchiostoma belcheri TaxID=7741 RepID=A0A6P5B0F2_BRABE|nr:PREDICTED: pinopsin-like [Branchiostoma belcheri]
MESVGQNGTFPDTMAPTPEALLTSDPTSTPAYFTTEQHLLMAVWLGFIGSFGFIANLLTVLVFWCFRSLRTPFHLYLGGIALSDVLVAALGSPFAVASAVGERWLFGRAACVWYAFVNYFLSIVSIVTMSAMSFSRYWLIIRPQSAQSLETVFGACAVNALAWCYSFFWTIMPVLGWSRFTHVAAMTVCSLDWDHHTPLSKSYIPVAFLSCLFLPLGVIIFSVAKTTMHLRRAAEVEDEVPTEVQAGRKTTRITLVMAGCWLVAWLPYACMALVIAAGGHVSPTIEVLATKFAKTSYIVNTIIYVVMDKEFRKSLVLLLFCGRDPFNIQIEQPAYEKADVYVERLVTAEPMVEMEPVNLRQQGQQEPGREPFGTPL